MLKGFWRLGAPVILLLLLAALALWAAEIVFQKVSAFLGVLIFASVIVLAGYIIYYVIVNYFNLISKERAIKYFVRTKQGFDLIVKAFDSAGVDAGFNKTKHLETNGKNVLLFQKESETKPSAFIILNMDETGYEECERIFQKAGSYATFELKKACVGFYAEEEFLKDFDEISDFIQVCLVTAGVSSTLIYVSNNDDHPIGAVLNKPVGLVQNRIIKTNITENGNTTESHAYLFTKEQIDALTNATRFEASQLLINWFDEVGVELFADR